MEVEPFYNHSVILGHLLKMVVCANHTFNIMNIRRPAGIFVKLYTCPEKESWNKERNKMSKSLK